MTQTPKGLLGIGRVLLVAVLCLNSSCRNVPSSAVAPTAGVQVVPLPLSLSLEPGAPFALTDSSQILVEGGREALSIGELFASVLRPSTGMLLPVVPASSGRERASIRLTLTSAASPEADESYNLAVTSAGVRLSAPRPAGLFRGVQTLRQLLPSDIESHLGLSKRAWTIPAVTIRDAPRFPWRGVMLDVARHFFTVKEVKQLIDFAALYKLNVLHLHLSDDQGFRIAIASRPRLTGMGSGSQVGGGEGGFYTQADYSEIVRYAAERYITVVPEIDMPAHTNAAFIGYPELSCGTRPPAVYTGTEVGFSAFCVDKEESYALVDDIVRELAAITPGKYLHVGGDEVHALTHPQYIKFVERVQTIVAKYGKWMIGWEEIGKARLLPTTIAQQWNSDSITLALRSGVKVLMSPSSRTYLDMKYNTETALGLTWAGYIDVRKAYDWDPAMHIAGITEKDVVGVEAPLWSETVRNMGSATYLVSTRLPALAEVAWSPQNARSWEDFRARLAMHARRWEYLGVNYYRSAEIPW